jgi:hypothetical protein
MISSGSSPSVEVCSFALLRFLADWLDHIYKALVTFSNVDLFPFSGQMARLGVIEVIVILRQGLFVRLLASGRVT